MIGPVRRVAGLERAAPLLMVVLLVACGASEATPAGSLSAAPSTTTPSDAPLQTLTLRPPSASPSATAEPTTESPPPPIATAAPTPSSTAIAGPLEVDWTKRAASGLGSGIRIFDSAVVNDRIVVIGSVDEDDGGRPAIWWEKDLVWQPATLPQTGSNARLSDITAGGPGLVAVGWDWPDSSGPRPLIWLSANGRTWEAVDTGDLGHGQMGRVGVTDAGLVGFATEEWDATSPVAWISSDGRHWQPYPGRSSTEVTSNMTIVGSGATLTVLFQPPPAGEEETGTGPVSVWRVGSPDEWTELGELPSSNGARVAAAAIGPLGWVAVGRTAEAWLAWTSADGATWQLATAPPSNVSTIFGDSAGFIGIGYYDPIGGCAISETNFIGQTWTSTDGRVWNLVDEFKPGQWIETLRRRGRTLIGIGVSYIDTYGKGTVWTARLPDTVSQPIAPAATPAIPPTNGCGP